MDYENITTLALLVLIGFITVVLIIVFFFIRNHNKNVTKQGFSDELSMQDAEINVIDLLYLVDSENRETFAELVVYNGRDKKRNLVDHLLYFSEREKVKVYFDYMRNWMKSLDSMELTSTDVDDEFTYIIDNNFEMELNGVEITRVIVKYCTPDEEKCLEEHYFFDFIQGRNGFLLYDINESKLYKKIS
jgi:hypothetical protein